MQAQALGFLSRRAPCAQEGFVHERTMLDRPSHRVALSLLETSRALAPEGGIVLGRHFPSRGFAAHLTDVLLLEPVAGAEDFRIRLAGFAMQCFYGRCLRGSRLRDLHGARDRTELAAVFGAVIASGEPHVHLAYLRDGGVTMARREIVSVPVTASDGRTPLVLAVSFWSERGWLN